MSNCETLKMRTELDAVFNAIDNSTMMILITDIEFKIIYANKRFLNFSEKSLNDLKNMNFIKCDFYDISYNQYLEILSYVQRREIWNGELWGRIGLGKPYWHAAGIEPILNPQNGQLTSIMMSIEDITENKMCSNKYKYTAYHDYLTDLLNRSAVENYFNYIVNGSNQLIGLLFIDFDKFKDINDNFGHDIGDELLKRSVRRIQSILDEESLMFRIGGDEFIILTKNEYTLRNIESFAQKVLQSMRECFYINEFEINMTLSMGVSIYPTDGIKFNVLLKNADTAMYRAKKEGRNNYRFYSDIIDSNKTI